MRNIRFAFIIFSAFMVAIPVCGASAADDGAAWVLADGVAATVDGVPVLVSDIQMEVDLGLLKTGEANTGFTELLQLYLNRQLILREVDELGGYRLTSGVAQSAYENYVGNYNDRADYLQKLRLWGIDEEEVFRRIRDALLVSFYTESRLQFLVNVLPSDIEDAYSKDPERWGERGLYDSWETIKADLIGETFTAEKERWLTTLRERYKLVLLTVPGGNAK